MNRQPKTLRVCFLAVIAFGLSPGGSPERSSAQTRPEPNALVEVSLMGSLDQVVIGLVGNESLSGEVHEIRATPFRLFVDLVDVVPRVNAVTPVNQGGVRQVRVALNQSDPPVTRVVLDLTHRAPYRVEEDPDSHEFRIIVGAVTAARPTFGSFSEDSTTQVGGGASVWWLDRSLLSQPPAESSASSFGVTSPTILEEYADWFGQLAQDVERILSSYAVPEGPAGAPSEIVNPEWQRLQLVFEMGTPPLSLQAAHDLLEAAMRLGRVGATERLDNPTPETDRAAARAGAALLMIRARDLVEAELAANSDSNQ